MSYENINLQILVLEFNSLQKKTNGVYPIGFVNLSLFAKTLKSVLVGILYTVKRLLESKSIIFSSLGRY
jgi:hypothetical protein